MRKFKVGDHVIIWAFGRRGIIVKAEGFAFPNYYVHCIETDNHLDEISKVLDPFGELK